MSVLTLPPPRLPIASAAPPAPKRWTVEEFHQLWEDDWFEDCKPMLLNGEIFEMAIPGPLHNRGVGLADYALRKVFGDGYWIRIQMPLVLGQQSDPVPDVAVVVGTPQTLTGQPIGAVLVVEVSDTSLSIDLGPKAIVYAAGGIADYWVIDINSQVVHVHRTPQRDPANPLATSYSKVSLLTKGQSISPLAAPGVSINVADLLPQPASV